MLARTFQLLAVAWLAFGFAMGTSASTAHRSALTREQLTGEWTPAGLLDNSVFAAAVDAQAARHVFSGELVIPEFTLQSAPPRIHEGRLLGKDTQRFPAVRIGFVSADGELLPRERDIVLTTTGSSYWDLIIDPGRVWSEPGDGGLSRAAFPFVLMNRLEGESHNGIATFLFGAGVSRLVLQVVQQTTPFYVTERFSAWGATSVSYRPAPLAERETMLAERAAERAARLPMQDWSDFRARFSAVDIDALAAGPADESTVISGLFADGTIFSGGCRTAAGAFPFCEPMRHGIWSVTKSMLPAVAMLRLAQKYGPEIYQQRLSDHLPLPAPASWRGVRFRDAVDMATGIGSGSHNDSPNNISDGYLTDRAEYDRWYQSPTAEERLRASFEEAAYPWGPGKVARYRDEDPLLLAAAMDGYLRTRAGPDADLWSMLVDEVYRPLGIVHLPQARTAPGAGGRTLPIAAFGMYATVADLVRVARLLRDGGRLDGVPLLWPEGVAQELDYRHTRGFATGQLTQAGEVRYAHYFWNVPFEDAGCRANVPQMQGWGGDVVALLPNGMIAFRIAHDAEDAPGNEEEMERLLRAAHAARSFCAEAG